MNSRDARRLLGLNERFDALGVREAYYKAKATVRARIKAAKSSGEQEAYRAHWRELQRARDYLLKRIGGTSQQQPALSASGVRPGGLIAGRYKITASLAEGTMATVYAARDTQRNADVALKFLSTKLSKLPGVTDRFRSEAEMARVLVHPNIAKTYEYAHDGDAHFIAIELVKGETLKSSMNRHRKGPVEYELSKVLRVGHAIVDALAYAHRTTAHLNLNPENIILASDGSVKLIGFGTARVVKTIRKADRDFERESVHHVSPEQLVGSKKIDARSDQYALAVMLFDMLTITHESVGTHSARKIRRDVPAALSDAIEKALSRSPDDRFDTIEEFGRAMAGTPAEKPKTKKAGKLVALLAGFLVLVGVGLGIGLGYIPIPANDRPANLDGMSFSEKERFASELQEEWAQWSSGRYEPGMTLMAEIVRAEQSLDAARELSRDGKISEATAQVDASIALYDRALDRVAGR